MSQLVQFGASECVSRVNWFSSGIQSAFRESIGKDRDFRACFVSQLVQVRALERVSRVNWFTSGPRSAYRKSFCRKSFDSDGNFGARIANHFISNHLIQI